MSYCKLLNNGIIVFFDTVKFENGFKINKCVRCIYAKHTTHGYVTLCIYVDGMLIIRSNDRMIKPMKDMLNSRFGMKEMCLANVILGIKIKMTSKGITLSQTHYINMILNKFNKDVVKMVGSPIKGKPFSKNTWESVTRLKYSKIIGSVMYLMSCT